MKHKLLFLILIINFHSIQCQNKLYSINYETQKIHESKIGIYFSKSNDKELILKLDSFILTKIDHLAFLFNDTNIAQAKFEFYDIQTKTRDFCNLDTTKLLHGFEPLGSTSHTREIKLLLIGSDTYVDALYKKWGGFYKVALHQYIHFLFNQIQENEKLKQIPRWIEEGVGLVLSDQKLFNTEFKNLIDKKIKNASVPEIQEFDKIKNFPNNTSFCNWSYLLCEFFIDTYGWDKFLKSALDYDKFFKIIGRDSEELNKEWLMYLKNKWARPNAY